LGRIERLVCPVSELWRRISASLPQLGLSKDDFGGAAAGPAVRVGPLGVVVAEIAVEIELEAGLLKSGGRPAQPAAERPGSVRRRRDRSGRGEAWSAAVYAADQPGLVARISKVLADHQVNIIDLETRLVGEPHAVCVMQFELEMPRRTGRSGSRPTWPRPRALGVKVSMRPDEPDVL
jgi:hypothetical protein